MLAWQLGHSILSCPRFCHARVDRDGVTSRSLSMRSSGLLHPPSPNCCRNETDKTNDFNSISGQAER
jgi:hypothetical protein